MNSEFKQRKLVLLILLTSFAALVTLLAVVLPVNTITKAQESVNAARQKTKSLRDLAQEKDVFVSVPSETDSELNLDILARDAQTIILGRITDLKTSFDGDYFLKTTYSVDVERIIKPLIISVAAQQADNHPQPFTTKLNVARVGGEMIVNNHKIVQQVPGQDQLNKEKTYIFFLSWSSDYQAYQLVGGISGVVLVENYFQSTPLATRADVKEFNSNLINESGNLENFIENLKKKQ